LGFGGDGVAEKFDYGEEKELEVAGEELLEKVLDCVERGFFVVPDQQKG